MSDEFSWLDHEDEDATPDTLQPSRLSRLSGLRRLVPGFLRRADSSAADSPAIDASPGRLRRILGAFPAFLSRFRRARPEVSAADLALQRGERPIEDLDDRLQALRQRSSAQPESDAESSGQALYDVDDVLVTPEIIHRPGGVISAVALSKAQQEQVALLRDMVGNSARTDESEPSSRQFFRPRSVFSLDAAPRLIGSILLLLAIALPFVSSDFREGELPPSDFHEDRHGVTTAYNWLDNLTRDDYALVAFEYGPAAAGELDPMADIILRHIMAQGATPIIVSGNPIAMVHARNVIAKIERSVAPASINFEENRDYYLLRYLSGGALGLRDLSENFDSIIRFSSTGKLTGLGLTSLDDLTLIVVIAERAEAIRNWAEQVATETETKLIAATGYAAQPLSQPYVDGSSEIIGLIVGIRDVYTYGEKLEAIYADFTPDPGSVVEQPTSTPTPPPTAAATATPTETATETPTPTETEIEPVVEPLGAGPATVEPTLTATPLAATATAQPAVVVPSATATTALIQVIEVTAGGLVNIRREPNTTSDILGVAEAGDVFEVIGRTDDGSWINFLMTDDIEAWIAEFLVDQYQMPLNEFRAVESASVDRAQSVLRVEFSLRLGKNRPRMYQVDPPGAPERPEIVLLRDRQHEIAQLDAMTLGTIAAVLIIVVGNVFYAMRGLLQRRRGTDGK